MLINHVKVKSESEVTQLCLTLCDPMVAGCDLWPTRLLCPWDFPGKNTGVRCHYLLQEIFPTQGLSPGLLHCRQIFYPLSYQGSPYGSADKESACNVGDLGLIPGLGKSPGEGNGNPLQYPCLENLMDRGALWAAVHGVAKSLARLSH